ncbi:immediate early response 3-interacting protein 1-like protein [Dinothrombium tinctorium]|uniref:Immediate early response 3-interacting protein 1 n=1 Tax=Dinothrombium tinctorium TaxID=1965070 RepID=A0A443RMF3_9ACAR|nr:immediate early response 3-interacting protein 1-like protein [Dinothrombium tinctorium]
MVLSIYNLYKATLLVINAIAILHEERFLAKFGWARNQMSAAQFSYGYQASQPGFKENLLNLIHSIRTVMRVPLILLNIITILFELVAG